MTVEELKIYENRIYELKDLILESLRKKDYINIQKYTNEIKVIKKRINQAKKESKKKEKMSSILG